MGKKTTKKVVKKTVEVPTGKPINETGDARITVTVSLPGQSLTDFKFELRNFRGNTIGRRKTIAHMEEFVRRSFIEEFGDIIK